MRDSQIDPECGGKLGTLGYGTTAVGHRGNGAQETSPKLDDIPLSEDLIGYGGDSSKPIITKL